MAFREVLRLLQWLQCHSRLPKKNGVVKRMEEFCFQQPGRGWGYNGNNIYWLSVLSHSRLVVGSGYFRWSKINVHAHFGRISPPESCLAEHEISGNESEGVDPHHPEADQGTGNGRFNRIFQEGNKRNEQKGICLLTTEANMFMDKLIYQIQILSLGTWASRSSKIQ